MSTHTQQTQDEATIARLRAGVAMSLFEGSGGHRVNAVHMVAAVSQVIATLLATFPPHLRDRAFEAFVSGVRVEFARECSYYDGPVVRH